MRTRYLIFLTNGPVPPVTQHFTAKTRQKVDFREADDVFCVDIEFKPSYGRFIDVAGRREKSE